MHKISLSETMVERARRRRAGAPPGSWDARKTAHIVIDLQNGFMDPGGPMEIPTTREIVSDVNRISAAIRRAGGTNVFLRFLIDPGEAHSWDNYLERFLNPQDRQRLDGFKPGCHDFELYPDLDVADPDIVMEKTRFSAFIPGTCDLHDYLTKRGIDTLIITGTATNGCCESTARDAMQMNYRVIFVSDCNAAVTDGEHNTTLNNMVVNFADVMTADEIIDTFELSA